MKITTFNNNKGLIHGNDSKRISCEQDGILKIGSAEVAVQGESIMPMLFGGGTGNYEATFTTKHGVVYDLGVVEVKGGRLTPPHPLVVEIMELRCREEALYREVSLLREEVQRLGGIFDTDSLNFLVK